ncbi:MAG: hypothetical protein HQRvContig05_33 [Haloquadratum phage sp.]|nr:MAG: hypothetical protein HQRvContig05_33 [Haloquadratum phage sp.]
MMEGGLVDPAAGVSATTVGGAGGPPSATGAPAVPSQSQAQTTQSGGAGQKPGVTTTVNVNETGPVDRALAGTAWTREDVELVLQTISTLLLLYWAVTEVQ